MSIEAMVWALNKAPVTDAAALLVLLGLANHASADGSDAFPSRETLARYARCSVRTVAVKLKALEAGDVIRRGDQQKLAHLRPDRRPVNYDLNYDVQDLHPVGSGYDVQSEVERGADHGNTTCSSGSNDVQTSAHKPSLTIHEPSVEEESAETEKIGAPATPSHHGDLEDEAVTSMSHYGVSASRIPKLFPGITWHPSRDIWTRAQVLYPGVDLSKVVVEYIQKNRTGKGGPDENVWLSWVAQAHRQHEEQRLKIEALVHKDDKPVTWYTVAD